MASLKTEKKLIENIYVNEKYLKYHDEVLHHRQ